MTTFGRRFAAERPGQVALRDSRSARTWAELDATLDRLAGAVGGADLGPERRVAVFAENSVEVVEAHLGGLLAGCSVVPLGHHLTAGEAAYQLATAEVGLVFAGPETEARAREAARQAGVARVVGWRCPEDADVEPYGELLAGAPGGDPPLDVAPRPNLLFTSGTTGRPKATELPPAMFAGGTNLAEHLERLAAHKFAPYGPHLVVGPLHHTGPLQAVRLPVAGVPVVVMGRFDAAATLAAIGAHRIETSVMVPTHLVRLLALPPEVRAAADVSSLRHVVHTGAPCPPEVKRAVIDWWGPVLWESYGATEVGTTCSITSQEWLERPGSVGRCVPPFEAVVVDADGRPVPAGTEGRLFFRDGTGRGIVYHRDEAASAAAHLGPGVFTMGEVGYLDEEGYVFITDRSADLVLSGGVNVYPAEVEQVLAGHPAVADVACIGEPDPDLGEHLVALVVPADPAAPPDEAEVLAWCRTRLAGPKRPRAVRLVAEIARTPMGKLDRRALTAAHRR